jgi:hypothetical protein
MLYIEVAGRSQANTPVQACAAAPTATEASLGGKFFVNALQESKKRRDLAVTRGTSRVSLGLGKPETARSSYTLQSRYAVSLGAV